MANSISQIKLPNNTTYKYKDNSEETSRHYHTTNILSNPSVVRSVTDKTLMPLINEIRANHLAFLPADQIIIEQTVDGGVTWTDYGMSDVDKAKLFTETDSTSIYIPLIDGQRSFLCGLRVTITAMKYNVPDGTPETEKYNYWNSSYVASNERYCNLTGMYFYLNTSSGSIGATVQYARGGSSDTWYACNTGNYMTGWSGNDYLSWGGQYTFGGSEAQTGNNWNWRITFMTLGPNGSSTDIGSSSTSQKQSITQIRGYGPMVWAKANDYMKFDHMYTHDYLKNVTFPNKVTATGGFSGNLTGTATTATNVSAQAGTINVNRHVWFSDGVTETKRNYDNDFMYNPSTNVLTVGSITGSAAKVNNHTVNSDVPADAIFTDTKYTVATQTADGLMSSADKIKLDGIAEIAELEAITDEELDEILV